MLARKVNRGQLVNMSARTPAKFTSPIRMIGYYFVKFTMPINNPPEFS